MELFHVTAGHPHVGMHDDARVKTDHVVPGQDKRIPPMFLQVSFQFHAQGPEIPASVDASIYGARLKDESFRLQRLTSLSVSPDGGCYDLSIWFPQGPGCLCRPRKPSSCRRPTPLTRHSMSARFKHVKHRWHGTGPSSRRRMGPMLTFSVRFCDNNGTRAVNGNRRTLWNIPLICQARIAPSFYWFNEPPRSV